MNTCSIERFSFNPFIWNDTHDISCPFALSSAFQGIRFLGEAVHYAIGDTIYPTWAEDGHLYTPFTDGFTDGTTGEVFSWSSGYVQKGVPSDSARFSGCFLTRRATTGQARIEGTDPRDLKITGLGVTPADPYPYGGRYPCGSLHHDGLWYYGTYCLSPFAETPYGKTVYNWPHLGPFVGFRISVDNGLSWRETPHTPSVPLFGEQGLCGYPIRIGAPHFVDFGRNLTHSPDGKAYLVAQGSDLKFYPTQNFAHLSWITADQIYLLRVEPHPDKVNDPKAYEFFAGHDAQGSPRWTDRLSEANPLLEWQNKMGCVTASWHPGLKRFFMWVTDGGCTCAHMHSYLLESESITGPWRLVSYLRNFGEQAYFLNMPSKFFDLNSSQMWLAYSGNFAPHWNGQQIQENPPGSRYGLVLQSIALQTST